MSRPSIPSRILSATLHPLVAVLSLAVAGNAAAQDDPVLPGPAAVEAMGVLVGEWGMSGVTGGDVDAAGRLFTARQSIDWIEPGRSLGVVWSVMREDGTKVTSGRGRINWDDIAGAVVNVYRGEEGGRPFTGSATLIAAEDGIFDWRGHETSGTSESVNFEVTYAFPSNDLMLVDFIPTCVDGEVMLEPSRFGWKRVNPFHEKMPLAPRLVGTWTLEGGSTTEMPKGSTMIVRDGSGGRSLVFTMFEPGDAGAFIGTELLWMDEETRELADRWIGTDGRVVDGKPALASFVDGRPALRVAWDPAMVGGSAADVGLESIVTWVMVDGDRLDVAFSGIDVDGIETEVEGMPPMTWRRSDP
ncbi:MAG: hypothetical protein VX012_07690, partial [Planctomycetota bacterium]|nr:hypothetical protein [Planctomycetota bacterium]